MLLQKLKEYADRRMADRLPPPLYAEGPVRYIVELSADGRLLARRPVDTSDPSSPRTRRGKLFMVPQVQRSSAIRPLLLADKPDYTLGLARDDTERERELAARRHAAYLTLLSRCAETTGEPAVRAVLAFLMGDQKSDLDLPADFDRSALMTFRVEGKMPIDLPSVQSFWASINDPSSAGEEAVVMQCLVCGRELPVLERLQAKIKGVRGGQTSGTSIISANAPAFESYGLAASHTAPTCALCGDRFTKAANELLSDRATHLYVGEMTFVFWTREAVPFSLVDFLDSPRPEQVRALLEAPRAGLLPEANEVKFYCAGLSPSGGRVVVRDWIDTTIGQVQTNLRNWFRRQQVVDAWGRPWRPLGLYALAAATVHDVSKDLSPLTPRSLMQSALTGSPLPAGLLYQAVRRNRAERDVSTSRAALIKLVWLSGPGEDVEGKEDSMVQLDRNNPSAAYQCGRLLAVLEAVQRLAVPGVKASITDRFFGTASSAPASVFGRLMRGAQPHLAKLERDAPAAHSALQARLEDILAALDSFPKTLTLEEQALFSLGYYHQRAYDRAQAREAAERRRAGASGQTSGPEQLEEDYTKEQEEDK